MFFGVLIFTNYTFVSGMDIENRQEEIAGLNLILLAIHKTEPKEKSAKKEKKKYDSSRRFGVPKPPRGKTKKKSTIVLRDEVPDHQRPFDWDIKEYTIYQKNFSDIYIGCYPENIEFTCQINHVCSIPVGMVVNFKELYEHYSQEESIQNGFCFESSLEKCEIAEKRMKKGLYEVIEHCCVVHSNMTKPAYRFLKKHFEIKRKQRRLR